MTPTEQDKELREGLAAIFYDDNYEYMLENEDMFDVGAIEEAVQLITADRKRVALEARIDEINYLDDNFQADSQDWEREHPGYSTAMIPMEDYIRRRTELKLEQNFEKR